ncbi:hypothetical protein ACK389_17035 [Streptomyces antibioticus]|uniref:DUF8017 domain-containing protein n=1 Tax=Streptomyces antibioticus TaxID=1890 RepID=A0AAE6Y5C3_STRAT|nr:hypothetical protein [Streptomyces antibioticus]OOQ54259.1 hypothetical protein AFM16_06735 [Streptomyces antibioticus]QIT43270.1 hypothetical protein HCX60_06865 [Streptomyces antibioticus]
MWPGQQPPGGEQNPQAQNNPYQQPGYQQPNPYQQPGYQQQPNPYGQQQPQWGAPTVPVGLQQTGGDGSGGGGGNRTKLVAIVAATAVVVTAGVTGFLVLGGKDDDPAKASEKTSPSPTASASASASASAGSDDNPRNGEEEKATIAGWKVVVNPKWGIAFDVPADWEVQSPGLSQGFEWEDKKQSSGYDSIIMGGTVEYKSKWCGVDDDKDGKIDYTPLAMAGSKGASGAKSTDEIAINTPAWWVFGGYTEPDKKSITFEKKATAYTTTSGVVGSYAWAQSTNTPQKGKCDSDGKAITFGFKNSKGDYVSWNWYGAKGVKEEVPKETVLKILSTVRLHGEPTAN